MTAESYQMAKWVKGQSGNIAGRPKTAFKEGFDQLVAKKNMYDRGLQIVNQSWDSIIEAMADQAIEGNHNAAIFLRDTFLGKPKETVEHDGSVESKMKITIEKIEESI